MKNALNRQKFDAQCGAKLQAFYDECYPCICRTDQEFQHAFKNFNFKMLDGFVFMTGRSVAKANISAAGEVLEFIGPDFASLSEVREILYKSFVAELKSDNDPTWPQYRGQVFEQLTHFLETGFSYIGPCRVFEFSDGVQKLENSFVSVLTAEHCLTSDWLPKGNDQWCFRASDDFGFKTQDGKIHLDLSGLCWVIHTQRPKDMVRDEASWMAQVFLSYFRLAIKPADYCHRPNFGEIEAELASKAIVEDQGFLFSNERFIGEGQRLINRYKVNTTVAEQFESTAVQDTLNSIFARRKATVAERLFNGLGWLARGRQRSSVSERLLFFFTAIEALLSDKDSFTPVADSIARYVSVILSEDLDAREHIHTEVKKLYGLRSDLIHRGDRRANLLNANNLQYFAEACFSVILKRVDVDKKHKVLISELKSAAHGKIWPIDR